MPKISCLEKPMSPVECRDEDFGGESSYAAAFVRALLDPDVATPAAAPARSRGAARDRPVTRALAANAPRSIAGADAADAFRDQAGG
jgi:hypothetical protein